MANAPLITAEIARQLLKYEPETGRLFWMMRPATLFANEADRKKWNARFAGKEAFTSRSKKGYLQGGMFYRSLLAHRVIWLLQTGEWPTELDHINGVRDDNRWSNLQVVTHSENCRNLGQARNNTSGISGVVWDGRACKWKAQIQINGRAKHLGYFDELELAAAARESARANYGFSARHGALQP